MLRRIREAVRPFPKAMLFELVEQGFGSPFEILVACIISIRTFDEASLPVAQRLLSEARTPRQLLALGERRLRTLLRGSTFAPAKALSLLAIARELVDEHQGELPCDYDSLVALRGVGPKCANLVLGIACGVPRIGVDIHVHRVTNRWGYVSAPTPEKTLKALEAKLPRRYWVELNRLLVPFGKQICTGTSPRCPGCPVLEYCMQVGVARQAGVTRAA